ncbi:hypothetical protein QO010_000072 [Caulobacter ginsengisoli]|uniref:Uncharacterized protein n=1 Tax=Caulobacter ginsengisoli TaxID=400775 RepID=A0ABU0IJZ5_9CAUL|nr:hypothetical protein [Caulobacter ginsengisoli]MDQ0462324.1 hypothetical protein [Caulobacter ginsengisoli]
MTPTVAELLLGNFVAFSNPPPPEAMGDFMTSRIGIVGMISMLAAQEADRGAAARIWENGAIRAMLARGGGYGPFAEVQDGEATIEALDAVNADLRRALIALHEAVEAAKDDDLDREILDLYVKMAQARRLDLPPFPAS